MVDEVMENYEMQTTIWNDLTMVERFGKEAIEDIYTFAFENWKKNYIYLTELVLVLNWKIWKHYENGNEELARIYNDLWQQTDEYAMNNLKDDELRYFLKTTD